MQINNTSQFKPRKNWQIKMPQVRLIGSDGSNIGIISTSDAIKRAQNEGLDLVEVNPRATPPVAKICDYGKMLYEEKKKAQAAKKNQQVQELKELTFRPNTDENDLKHKLAQAKEFLAEGNRVKFTIRFRGREVVHSQIGKDRIGWILSQLNGLILPNPQINMEGKFMSTTVSPLKK
jgi:translation initiation factor IF-3